METEIVFASEFKMEIQFHGCLAGCVLFHSECEEQDCLGRYISKTQKLAYVRCLSRNNRDTAVGRLTR